MIYCQNCRQANNEGTNFCRSCGNRLFLPQGQPELNESQSSPRPYMWKTDEYQVKPPIPTPQNVNQFQTIPPPYNNNWQTQQAITYAKSSQFVAGYCCPRCGTQNLPYIKRQISTIGWITFAVLLVMTGIFFWIGLLIKEDVRVCSDCGLKLS